MDEELITKRHCNVMLLHNVIDVSNCGADKEGEDESNDIMTSGPEIDVDGIEDGEERESPRNAVDDCFLALREELIYDSTEKKNMNKRPDEERPRCWSDVRLFSIVVYG